MKRGLIMVAAVGALAAAAAVLPGAATAGTADSDVPTFQEFRASSFVDSDGQYIVNGDEAMTSDGHLQRYYDRMVGSQDGKAHEDGLIVNRVNGQDDRWSASQAMNLTYCVSTKFGANHTAVVHAMTPGAGRGESASSKVNFTHVPSADADCTWRNNAVLFSVEPTTTTQYIARAFLPSTPDRSRNVLVNATSLQNSGHWEPGDIMAHELGHALGFRHEHTRPEAGTCFEDDNWRALTPYDSASIMPYPQCNGASSDLEFSANDGNGVRALYGS